MRRSGIKRPTWTHLVEEALRVADDFISAKGLVERTGGNSNQIHAALWHLQRHRVVDSVEGPEGLFWFLRGEDLREREVGERTVEDKPRRQRRVRKVAVK
jgi:hypothetical protein